MLDSAVDSWRSRFADQIDAVLAAPEVKRIGDCAGCGARQRRRQRRGLIRTDFDQRPLRRAFLHSEGRAMALIVEDGTGMATAESYLGRRCRRLPEQAQP